MGTNKKKGTRKVEEMSGEREGEISHTS